MTKTLACIAALSVALIGCASEPEPVASHDPSDVIGVDWTLTDGTDGGVAIENPDTHPITFRVEDGRVSGKSACNNYNADITLGTDGALEVGLAMQTMMACDPREVMVAEQAYTDALGRLETWRMDGGELVLEGPDTTLRFAPTGDGPAS